MVNSNRTDPADDADQADGNSGLPDSVGRRSFLKAAGAAAVVPLVAHTANGAPTRHHLEIVSTKTPSELATNLEVTYEFTTTGRIEPDTDNGRNSAEENDSITDNGDGTWTATGKTGNGFGDAFYFEGRILEFGPTDGEFLVRLDGDEVAPGDIVSPYEHVIEVVSTEDPSELTYEFTTSEEIVPHTDNGDDSAEDNDTVAENDDGTWTATGYTGNGYGDAFFFDGELQSFAPIDGPVEVFVDGSRVDLSALAADDPSLVEVLTTEDPSELSYEFTASGEVTRVTDNGDDSAEDNDTVTDNGDDTWTVSGYTGNGYGDAFRVDGEIQSFGPVTDFVEVRVDGTAIDLSQFDSAPGYDHVVEVLTTEDPSEISYQLTTSGEIARHTDNGDDSAEENDSVTENDDGTWSVSGYTGNGYGDAFFFDGALQSFGPVTDFVEVRVDGTAVDLSNYETETVDSGPDETLGGGEGYDRTVPESEADVVVSDFEAFERALASASSGDVVYVAGDATIDVGTSELTVPSGVTLASDRGIDGAAGGEVVAPTIDQWPGVLTAQDDVRVTGLRLSGPLDEYQSYTKPVMSGLVVDGTDCEVDNVEVTGFNHAAVRVHESTHVHHSHIHSNPMDGLGYGVLCKGGDASLVEYNLFNYNRHSVANDGSAGYEVRYNHFGDKAVSYQVGTHQPGGTTLHVHHNTFEPTQHIATDDDVEPHVNIRGTPEDVADIHHNWFHSPEEPLDSPDMWTNEAIVQVHVDEWTNVEFGNNAYGSAEPADDVGCPR